MGYEISVDPADLAGVHVSDLKEVVDLWVACCSAAVDDVAHPPILVRLFSGQVVVSSDHGHSWSHVEKDRMLFGLFLAAEAAVNGHAVKASTYELAVKGGLVAL